MSDTPDTPAPDAPPPSEPAAQAPPSALPPSATLLPTLPKLPWVPIIVGIAAVASLAAVLLAWPMLPRSGSQEETYVVQAYTPNNELITGRDRVEARAEPDAAGRVVVIFGAGVTLNVSGRVQRGLAGDWYAISWNDQTAFVRVQDVVAGSGAPPAPIVRERPPPEIRREEQKPEELTDQPEERPQAPSAPSGALGIGDVNWIRQPNARDFARYFPDRALDAGQSGNVTLSCIIGGSGRLACSVVSESPGGYGFGDAALGISRQLRVRTRLPDGSGAEGRELRLPLSFRAH